jgi:hypothetical protein
MYDIQHCFICRPSDSTVSEDAGIEPRTVTTIRHWLSDALTIRLDLIHVYTFLLMQDLEDYGWLRRNNEFSFDPNVLKLNLHKQDHPHREVMRHTDRL